MKTKHLIKKTYVIFSLLSFFLFPWNKVLHKLT